MEIKELFESLTELKETNNKRAGWNVFITNIKFDGIPILQSGRNELYESMIASIIDEDYDCKCMYYFQMIVDDITADNFTNNKISLLDVIKSKEFIFIAKRDYNDKLLELKKIMVKDIPIEFLPTKDSYLSKQ